MVLFKIGGRLSIAAINRRLNKRDESKDVLGKVTLIQNIVIEKPAVASGSQMRYISVLIQHDTVARRDCLTKGLTLGLFS